MVLLWGPMGRRFLMSEVPLYRGVGTDSAGEGCGVHARRVICGRTGAQPGCHLHISVISNHYFVLALGERVKRWVATAVSLLQ